jgi:starch synthase
MLRVVMIAGECVPFVKVGGLADVIGALPLALQPLGVEVSIVLPRYRAIDLAGFGFHRYDIPFPYASLGWEELPFDVHCTTMEGTPVKVFLIGNNRFFDRDGIYLDPHTAKDFPDQADRWVFFNRAAMEFLKQALPQTDILHSHDHQAGLIPAYLRRLYRRDGFFAGTGSVFTIHNMGYQGLFPREVMLRTGFDDAEFYPTSPFEFYGLFNFMKVGISYADIISTVSSTYAREIQASKEYGYGLEGVLRERSADITGIQNGIDDRTWDPAVDPIIPAHFTITDLSGKHENKKALLREFGLLDESRLDWPLLAMISRIDVQKGFDLLVTILDYLLSKDLFFVLLGSGNKETEAYLQTAVARHRSKASVRFAFEGPLAHLIEAGADLFLMPSKYEPCGLNQMYSLRYGTIPIVRSTGGLADTVSEFDPSTGEGTGFCFVDYDSEQFKTAVDRALALWPDKNAWAKLMRNGMERDFSWNESAKKYLDVYKRVVARHRP